ncbi:DUF3261 domain-containing protein [Marinobacter oulmenensis]|uniref:DUF3261 domain-containing protein n=1 Tax=Marinobacter oulmenensis TaxID=643747 RepID=A0A840UCR9_9GAMM|nr:hypothetical protein [Marinobacter oulmenensis]
MPELRAGRYLSLAVVLFALSALGGCQLLGVRTGPLAPPLLAPASGGLSVQLNQRMTLDMDGKKHHLVAVSRLAPNEIRMTGFTLTGQRLFDFASDDNGVSRWQAPQVERQIPARWMLTQLQLAYWPEAALKAGYSDPWRLSAAPGERALYLEDELLVMVSYAADFDALRAGSELTIEHHRMGLTMTMETLKAKDLATPDASARDGGAGQ